MNDKAFVLLCAGEDSGDALGEGFVAAVKKSGLDARGVGGSRMVRAGLTPVVDFEELPVSGFGDVLPRYIRLRKLFNVLKTTLRSPDCVAFVAIDYPGFNMALAAYAKKLKKPVLYVAPPQVWAWKRSRAKKLRSAKLAVLFEFEKNVYETSGCNVQLLRHPFMDCLELPRKRESRLAPPKSGTLLLLPGSRKSQALRNMPFFADVASRYVSGHSSAKVVVLASRATMKSTLDGTVASLFPVNLRGRISVQLSPEEACARASLFSSASLALCAPGTSSLELALCGVPLVVCGILDPLTYLIGKHFVDIRFFALPNILLSRKAVPEVLVTSRMSRRKDVADSVVELLDASPASMESRPCAETSGNGDAVSETTAVELCSLMSGGETPDALASEFLGQLVQCDSD